ncbi:MAG: hypothetical protein R2867_24430 [Caldilineaceae bacterium]
MGFIMDGLDAEAYDRSYTDRELLKRIIGYFQPHLKVMSGVATMVLLNSLMESAFPILILPGLNRIRKRDRKRATFGNNPGG